MGVAHVIITSLILKDYNNILRLCMLWSSILFSLAYIAIYNEKINKLKAIYIAGHSIIPMLIINMLYKLTEYNIVLYYIIGIVFSIKALILIFSFVTLILKMLKLKSYDLHKISLSTICGILLCGITHTILYFNKTSVYFIFYSSIIHVALIVTFFIIILIRYLLINKKPPHVELTEFNTV